MLFGWFNITIEPIDADDAEAEPRRPAQKALPDSNAALPASDRLGSH
jgi:hypothetical protein